MGGIVKEGTDFEVLTNQLQLMRDRLIEEGERIPDEPLVVEYDNGGGQYGVRENPFYPAYEKLLNSYVKTLAYLNAEGGKTPNDLPTLDDFKRKYKIAK